METENHFNCIYKLTSPSGKVYIGQTRNFNRRINEHQKRKNCKAIHNAIEKYGIDSFTIEILKENINPSDLNKWEIYFINQFDSFNNGYNLTIGGDGARREDGHGIRYGTGRYGITSDDSRYQIERYKEYYQRPDVKEHRKEYYQRPDVKEKKKASDKEYRNKPDVKEHRKEMDRIRRQNPERKAYMKEYYQRPDVKERRKERRKEYIKKQKAIKKALEQNNGQMPLSAFL